MHYLNNYINTLRGMLPSLKERYPIDKLALFGSVTRSDFDPVKSDIDILIEFNGSLGWEIVDLAMDLEKILDKKIDLVAKEAIPPKYFGFISKDLIYV